MDHQDWLERWQPGNIGFHQAEGSRRLREFWPEMPKGARVLVPLCGKTVDLRWLSERGLEVVGVELSEIAAKAFFEEQSLDYERTESSPLVAYRAKSTALTLYCGDYFEFRGPPFDALYDRASLVALNGDLRPRYIEHTKSLLKPGAKQLLLTLEYDQSLVDGPPFSVLGPEVETYWPKLHRMKESEALETCPPRFKQAGVPTVSEVTWLGST